jgi:hypothetical protein
MAANKPLHAFFEGPLLYWQNGGGPGVAQRGSSADGGSRYGSGPRPYSSKSFFSTCFNPLCSSSMLTSHRWDVWSHRRVVRRRTRYHTGKTAEDQAQRKEEDRLLMKDGQYSSGPGTRAVVDVKGISKKIGRKSPCFGPALPLRVEVRILIRYTVTADHLSWLHRIRLRHDSVGQARVAVRKGSWYGRR